MFNTIKLTFYNFLNNLDYKVRLNKQLLIIFQYRLVKVFHVP